MKNTGIIRNIDELGRIVIPKEMRKALNINNRDELEIVVENDKIVISKIHTGCVFCGTQDNLSEVKNSKYVCVYCLTEMHN
jgi:transcriptional pleiotropic regulator of transition state genes